MQLIMTSSIFTIISLLICNAYARSTINALQDRNETDICGDHKDCFSCLGVNECSFWYCNQETNLMVCANFSALSLPPGCNDIWIRVNSRDKCQTFESTKVEHKSDVSIKSKPSVSYTKSLINDDCAGLKDCDSCFGDSKCVFWWCDDNDLWTGDMVCQDPKQKKPKTSCSGKWSRLEKPDNCSSVHRKNSTTTTTTSTKSSLYLDDFVESMDKTIHKLEGLQNKELSLTSDNSSANGNDCAGLKDCESCFGNTKCAFWWCDDNQFWTGDMVCQDPKQKKPKTGCSGEWSRLENPENCSTVHRKNSTTTTTTTTTTTQTPETTTDKNTTTTTPKSTTTVPITTPPTTVNPSPHNEGENKLTGWTIAGITISSLLVITVLIGVSYKKVMKIYRARNPYRTLND